MYALIDGGECGGTEYSEFSASGRVEMMCDLLVYLRSDTCYPQSLTLFVVRYTLNARPSRPTLYIWGTLYPMARPAPAPLLSPALAPRRIKLALAAWARARAREAREPNAPGWAAMGSGVSLLCISIARSGAVPERMGGTRAESYSSAGGRVCTCNTACIITRREEKKKKIRPLDFRN